MRKMKIKFPINWNLQKFEEWIERNGFDRIKEFGFKIIPNQNHLIVSIVWNELQ